ncbi:phasin family protein [Bradyrhizobium canariense]|uniref:phasin family protein n=1 Tax=Bradyrhizobium canariense TaxID=255045 RepID=UPI001FE36689|nr:phasin family protein [Bradyrhizobium canariense]
MRTSDLTFAYIESYQPNFTRSAAQPQGARPIRQRATERSARNAETIMYSATAVAKGMNGVSREYFEFVRQQIERSMDRMNELWRCRTPHDLAAVQTDLVRDTIRSAMDSSRRMADMSLKVVDDAGDHIAQSVERMQRAA